MKKLMATIGVVFIMSNALAQTRKQPTPDESSKKVNHGHTVSTAAHQDYEGPGKGRFISQIARLKNKASRAVSNGQAKGHTDAKALRKADPDKKAIKAVTTTKNVKSDKIQKHLYAHKPVHSARPARVGKANLGRRPTGTSRITHTGRG